MTDDDGRHDSGESAGGTAEPASPRAAIDARLPLLESSETAWPIAAAATRELTAYAMRLAEWAGADPGPDPLDVAWTLASGRPAAWARAVVVGGTREELVGGLAAVAAGEPADSVVAGPVPPAASGDVVFVFPGLGSQWAGMGRDLAAVSPVFAARLTACERALAPFVDWSLSDVLDQAPGAPGLEATEVLEPVLWAVMVSLAAVWEAAGVVPDAVVGHSMGEVAAACVAGMLNLDDAARVIAMRSKALSELAAEGGMISVVMPLPAVRELLYPWSERLSVAAVNGPAAVVVSGDLEALAEFEAELSARRVMRWRLPQTDFVAHSAMVDRIEEGLLADLAAVRPLPGRCRLFSATEGRWKPSHELDAAYWYASERRTVRYDEAVRGLAADGIRTFVEVSPHPVLTGATTACLDEAGVTATVTATLHHEDGGARRMLLALAGAHVAGTTVDWAAVVGAGRRLDLPPAPEPSLSAPADSAEMPWSRLARQVRPMSRIEQERFLTGLVLTEAAEVLGRPASVAVEPDRVFNELGFDSLAVVRLRTRLGVTTGLALPVTTLFDHPTPAAAAEYLRGRLTGETGAGPAPTVAAVAADDDPIAVVATGCRFAGGVQGPEDLWALLAAGGDAVAGFPADRGWNLAGLYDPDPDHPGTTYVRSGGFLHDAAQFDPGFFGISPREALAMDPQQRLMLEVSWEALERAGIAPRSLRGTATGVFVGSASSGYGYGERVSGDLHGHLHSGVGPSVTSGRVSYLLGLEGPAITVDTACSSSLVALHLACQSLRTGESSLALAGGVTVIAGPAWHVWISRQRGLSADGRSKSFSAGADGMGVAEGAGLLVLERLSDARRHGHPVLAVVRGTALNQDGASNGLTAPNGTAQQKVIRAALANAGLGPDDVDAVEAHGSGTPLGDPIEAHALMAVYGQDRSNDRPLWLGSIKSNVGHTQWAAGAAGLIKTVLALQHGVLPQTLHAHEASPHIDWSAGDVRLLTEPVPWPANGRPRRAGVSSFGMSGTNAHVILEEAPAPSEAGTDAVAPLVSGARPWLVSGRTDGALRAQAARLAERLTASPQLDPADVSWSLATARSMFEYRAAVLGDGHEALLAGLTALASGRPAPGVVTGLVPAGGPGRVAFVFPGQGSQWEGMGRELAACSPVFAARLAECSAALAPYVEWSLDDVLAGRADLARADVVQPALWAVMVSLAAVWEAAGVVPDTVVGHSQGEIAAATVAGMLSLETGARVVAVRSRALSGLRAEGGMVSVVMPVAAVRELMEPWADRLAIAAVNGPAAVVVSGELEALAEFEKQLSARRVMRWRIPETDFVAHSAAVEGLEQDLRDNLAGLRPETGRARLYSTALGRWVDGAELDAGYWYANVRNQVRFDEAIRALADDGHRVFVEVSPHPILEAAVADTVEEATGLRPVISGTMHRENAGAAQILLALSRLHVAGVPIDWARVLGSGQTIPLPTYAFQRQRFWADGAAPALGTGDSSSGSWLYRESWTPIADRPTAALPGNWLLLGPAEGALVEDCARTMSAHGATVTVERVAADRAALTALLREKGAGATGVVSLLALTENPLPAQPAVPAGLAATLALAQALGDADVTAPLWILTSGAVAAVPGDEVPNPMRAGALGLGRTIALESPDRWGGLIDLPAHLDGRAGDRLCAVLAGRDENEVAIRAAGLLARRIEHAPAPRPGAGWQPRGTVLVTGGTGALGTRTARWLSERGADRVVLVGRSGASAEGVAAMVADLAQAGTAVAVVVCDVADRDAVAGLVDSLGPELTAVVHTAGVLDDGVLDGLDETRLATALAAKSAGAAHLDELTAHLELDAFVLFSSAVSTFGSAGQGNYAAANACLDALALNRRARGLAGTALAWGTWAGGVALASETVRRRLSRGPYREMDPAVAVDLIGHAVTGPDALAAVMDVDWPVFAGTPGLGGLPAVRNLPEVRALIPADAPGDPAPAEGELSRQLAGLPRAEQERLLIDVIRGEAARVLGHDGASAVDTERPFSDLGFDSLTTLEMRQRMSAVTGLRLPATLLFDYPAPQPLAGYLRAELAGDAAAEQAPAVVVTGDPADGDPIVIVGMSCRYPGGVRDPEGLWDFLMAQGDAIAGLPRNRGWRAPGLEGPGNWLSEGGFVHDADQFDPAFFSISPREAQAMDPQQRLVLETTWEALERGGIDPRSLRGSSTGVFLGGYSSGYLMDLRLANESAEGLEGQGLEGHLNTGNATCVLSGRVSYTLGLEGPALTIDTACSSSLVALHTAVRALRSGEVSLALAGGATIMAVPGLFGFSREREQGQARDGRSKAFSAAADGMSIAEGVGILALERMSDARRHGHPVLAVVAGTAINQDGASNGLTAPNGLSQQRVIRAALADAGLSAADVDAVEAHGTGTELGDPIEAHALLATYGQERDAERPLLLGSVKSNIGHCQAAAGVAGVIKMVMAMRHGVLPATLHADETSPHIDWSAGAVRLATEPVDWATGGRSRRAGVSAFGASGTNAHVILESAPAFEAGVDEAAPVLPGSAAWVVSGRTAEALTGQAGRLAAHLAARPDVDPGDVAWSLATTRSVFEHRAVVLGGDRATLDALVAGRPAADAVTGQISSGASGRVVFVFPGQGAQWAGMGQELAVSSPIFAARLDECSVALAPHVDWSLPQVLAQAEGAPGLDRADVVQPVLWAVMVSLAAVWEAAGVVPDVVLGHSQGEIAAATVAGMLSLQDAARVVAVRSRALSGLGAQGGMLSVVMPVAAVRELMEPWAGRLAVAAVNSPAAVVVSGDLEALGEFERQLSARRVMRWRIPRTDFVAHSAGVEDLESGLLKRLDGLHPMRGRSRMFSSALGRWVDGVELGAAYWYANVRNQVRFDEAVRELAGSGHRVFVEVSAHPVLTAAVTETFIEEGLAEPVVAGTLSREDGGEARVLRSLAEVFVRGVAVDWPAVLGAGRSVDLPTYAFQRQRYWPVAAEAVETGPAAEDRFWAAVEGGDVSRLEEALEIDARQPLREVLPVLASWRRGERDRSVAEAWRYRISWVPVPDAGTARLTGKWLLVTPADGQDAGVAEALSRHGAEVVRLIGSADRGVLAAELSAATGPMSGVVSLLALDEGDRPASGPAMTQTLIQALGDAGIAAPLWALTRGAVAVDEALTSPVQAQAWGLGRVAGLEHPERWGGLVDLPPVLDDRAATRLCGILAASGEDQVAVRGTGVFARRLERAPRPRPAEPWTPSGTALITGGSGAVAGHTARWLAGRGAPRVILASRSGTDGSGAAALAAELARAGTAVEVVTCDVSRRDEVAGLLSHIAAGGPPLTAVLHTAGLVQNTPLEHTDVVELAEIVAAKVGGARHLDELTADLELEAFVMFSSIAATWGSGQQPAYAAANTFLDALAENRRGRGLAATSVAWGPWGDGGMTDAESAAHLRRRGLRVVGADLGVRALAQAVDGREDPLVVVDVDWAQFAPPFVLRRPSPLIGDLPEVREALAAAEAEVPEPGTGEFAQRLGQLSAIEQERLLVDLVRSQAAPVLGHASGDAIDVDSAFSDMGFDSITAVELRNRLGAVVGLRLPATLLFDQPTVTAVAKYLRTLVVKDESPERSLLSQIAKLDALLSAAGDVPEVTGHLEDLVARWKKRQEKPGGVDVAEGLAAAGDDEIFDFIGKELGIS